MSLKSHQDFWCTELPLLASCYMPTNDWLPTTLPRKQSLPDLKPWPFMPSFSLCSVSWKQHPHKLGSDPEAFLRQNGAKPGPFSISTCRRRWLSMSSVPCQIPGYWNESPLPRPQDYLGMNWMNSCGTIQMALVTITGDCSSENVAAFHPLARMSLMKGRT